MSLIGFVLHSNVTGLIDTIEIVLIILEKANNLT